MASPTAPATAAMAAPMATAAAPPTQTAAADGLPTLDPRTLDPRTPVIVGYARTPMGSFLGRLAPLTAPQLGGAAIRAALARCNANRCPSPPPRSSAAGHAAGPQAAFRPLLPSDVDEVLMGCVCSANLGQAPASQAARLAGLPDTVPATLVNKVCASGLKAVALAAQAILSGGAECVIAGGMESMSNVPHYLPGLRTGATRLGHGPPGGLVDGLLRDGLWCAEGDRHMGDCAELAAATYGFSREEQDDAAVATFARARWAEASGAAAREIAPVEVPLAPPPPSSAGGGGLAAAPAASAGKQRAAAAAANGRNGASGGSGGGGMGGGCGGGPSSVLVVDRDEPLTRLDEAKLRALRPHFKRDGTGTVTAGNASPLTDGAAAVVLVSARLAAERGLPALAAVRSSADANGAPEWFSTAPSKAAPLALARAGGLSASDVDFWEVNEAFMVVDLVNRRLLGLEGGGGEAKGAAAAAADGGAPPPPPSSRVNAHGGAVALGHAIGASGAVLVGRLVNVLRTEGGRLGCAVICNGGGGATAVVLEAAPPGG